MEPISDHIKYLRPHLLHDSPRSQVVRCAFRDSRGGGSETQRCVLKFFPAELRSAFEREVAIYRLLSESKDDRLRYARPFGFGEWTNAKYQQVIGRKITPLETTSTNRVYALMLEYLEATVPTSNISPELARSVLSSLESLHKLGIVHGDISASNVLLLPDVAASESAVWIDFSYSWTDASNKQRLLERDRAIKYFAGLVFYTRLPGWSNCP